MHRCRIFSLAFLISCGGGGLVDIQKSPAQGYLIQDVRVFTAAPGSPVIEHADVLIQNDRIVRISRERMPANGATVIAGNGRTLLPGLSDCHTHVTGGMILPWKMTQLPDPDHNLRAALYSGITAIWDMGGKDPSQMNAMRGEIDSGSRIGPALYHSGIAFTGKGAHPVPYLDFVRDNLPFILRPFVPAVAHEVATKEGVDIIRGYSEKDKPDFTKIYLDQIPEDAPIMPDANVQALVSASHERHIPTMFHIGSNDNLRSLITNGGDGAVHNVYKDELDPALAKLMAQKGIFVVPTIVAWYNYSLVVNQRSFNHFTHLEYESMSEEQRAALLNPQPDSVVIREKWKKHDALHVRYTANLYPNLKRMKDAGVTILAGSDAPNYALTIGGSLHTELMHLVKAGMSNSEALEAATSRPAQVLARLTGKKIEYGEVREGWIANLLLVDGDPTSSITDTQKISEVFFRGQRIDRKPPKMQ